MKGRKTLRRAGVVLGFSLLLSAGVMASGAFGMHLDAGTGTTDSSSTATDTAPPPSDSTSTGTASSSTTTATDTTTAPATTSTAPVTYSPKIQSDKADYSPGETVTLSGSGWAPSDSVHIFVNDDEGKTWSYSTNVTADANGNFSVQFQLPTTFVATYSVTATGAISGTATTTFTDGNVTLHLLASEGVANMTVTFDRWNGNTTCTGTPTLSNQTVTATSGGTVNIPGFGGTGDSVKLKSVSTTTSGKTFSSWTSGDKNTDSGTLLPGSPTPCISNSSGGSNGNVTDAYAHFVNSTATLIVIKHVVNNNGGTATAGSFAMSVTGGSPSPANFSGAESPGTSVTITPNMAYSVGETGPTGYTRSDSAACASTTGIAPGATATCTVTNDDQAATLTVIKHVINNNGGTKTAADFTMNVTGSSPSPSSFAGAESPGTTVTLNAGAYSVDENAVSGYTKSIGTGCSGTLAPGGTASCTITNDDQAATLTVIKHVINNNGGTKTASDFTMNVTGGWPSPSSFAGAESPGTTVTLNAGSYSVDETAVSGYTKSIGAGCSGTLALGGSASCTITNDDQAATLTVIKHVINDNGGSATASQFTMNVTGGSPSPASFAGAEAPGTPVTLNAGNYSVGETGPSGYTASLSSDCTGSIANGASKTCTVTNDDQAAHLIVIKHVVNDNGGTASASAFTMNIGGVTASGGNSFPGAESPGTDKTLTTVGSYSVLESGPAGYSGSASTDCSGTIALGQTKTCTFTNNDAQPILHVIKHVVNDNGGTAQASDFKLSTHGTAAAPADGFDGAESPGTTVHMDAGSYNVTETGPSGYADSYSANCSGSLAVGDEKTCTVTNNDVQPKLVVIKHVINDNGGTKTAANFTMNVTGASATPSSFAGAESPGTDVALNAGSYSVSEGAHAGYADSSSADCAGIIAVGQTKTCTVTNNDIAPKLVVIKHVIDDNGGTAVAGDFTLDSGGTNDSPDNFPGAELPGTTVTLDAGSFNVTESGPSGYAASFSADCAGTLSVGDEKTCTVTNNDIAPKLHVIKHVINDNGGAATAASFTLDSGGTNDSPDNFAGAESPGTLVTLDAGSYSVTESGPSGYAASFSADCAGTLSVGDEKTCTVTNNDIAPKLVVIKHVVNDNGGTAGAGDFTLDSGGANDTPDNFAGDESGTTVTLDAGSYGVTESGPSGYARSDSADCSGSIAVGQTKTCTVTNDDIAPKLVVNKHVVNDNGGTAVASDFTLDSGGPNDTPDNFAGAESPGTTVTLDAGSYAVTESGPSGYARSDSADCSGSIAVGQTKTCTVTNNDIAPKLHVIKHVINDNGGTATAASFTLDSGGTNDSPDNFAGAESPGTTVTLDAGSFNVTESGPSGYAASFSADCAGTLVVGDEKTCTVTNNDIQPKLYVIKHVVNDNGGTKAAGDFTMSVSGNNASPGSFPGAEAPGTTVALDAGSYSVSEGLHTGYALSTSADCSGSISVGQTKTCTVTNNDIQPKLYVIKHVVNDNGGTKTAANFNLSVTGTNASPGSFPGAEAPGTTVALDAGSYSVSEGSHTGYADSYSADCSGSIDIGETKTCTVTNDDIQPKLYVIKHVINDNGGTKAAGDFSLSVTGTNASPGTFPGAESPGTTVALDAGTYSVSESSHTGYALSTSADCSGSISVGETKTCTVTNNDIQPKLYVIKHVINDNGGTATAANFTMSVTGQSPVPSSFPGAESPGTTVALDAGSYAVTESGPSGYAESDSADCSGSIAIGETKTCTITNNDIQPKLTVIKHVVNDNGGTATASQFTISVTGNSPNPASFGGAESPGTDVAINAGNYSVGESGPSGYAMSTTSDCSGSISVGQTKTCTVTNNDIQPKLVVIKHVINDDGATKQASDFTLTVTGSSPNPASFPGADSPGTDVAINAGSYSVVEGAHTGYAVTYSTDCNASIAVGETKTCTVTNDDDNQPPVITSFTNTNNCLFGPLVFVPCTFSGTFHDSALADNPWVVNWSFDGTADPPNDSIGANATYDHSFGPRNHTYNAAGCSHTATAKVTDKDGASDSKTITVQVGTGGFLPPVTNTPVTNKLKNGQVLPVKIQITDCNGVGVNNLQPLIRLVQGDQTTIFDDSSVPITPPSVSAADTNGVMRSSGTDGSYIYNMSVNIPLNTDYTIVIYPYGNTPPNDKLTLRHVIQATK